MNTLELMFAVDVAVSGGGFKKLEMLQGQFARLQQAGEKLQGRAGQITSFQKMGESVQSAASRLDALRNSYRQTDASLTRSRERTASLASQYEKAKQRVSQWSAAMPKHSVFLQTAIRQEKELAQAYKASQKETQSLERARDQLYRKVGTAEASLERENASLREMGQALREAGVNTENLAAEQAKLSQASEKVQRTQAKLQDIRGKLTWNNFKGDLFQSAASVMTLSVPVRVNKDFEQAMADVAAVARPTAEEFKALTDQAKLLGRTTQYTAMDAAHAQQNLIRSGMKAGQVIEAMPAILNLSSAEGLSIDEASSIIAKGLGGMNLGAEFAPKLADALAYASANSNTDVAMLGEAFKVAAPTLASQGVKFDQVAAYLGVLANKGYEGSEAGNALSSSFLRLARRPKATREALTALGVRTRTKQGKMVELPEIMRQISAAFEKRKMGENQQLEYLGNIFGGQYGKQMMAFMQAVKSGDAQTFETDVREKSAGWAAKSTSIRTNTLQGDLAGLSSAWEGLMNRIGETLNPFVRQGVQWLTSLTNGITDLIEKAGIWGDLVITIGAGLASWKVIATVWKYGKLLVQLPFAKMGATIAEAGAQAALTGQKMGMWPSLLSKVSAAFTWLGNIILAHPLLALAGLSAAVVTAVIMNWDKVKAWWSEWFIPNVWEPVAVWCSEVSAKAVQYWENVNSWFASLTLPNIWESLTSWCTDTINTVKGMWESFCSWVSSLNPFSGWKAPEINVAGGKEMLRTQSGNKQLNMTPSYMQAHAEGGILTRPHIGLVAEAGPEAIIPLTDRQRGMSLLETVAGYFGATLNFGGKSEKNKKIGTPIPPSANFSQNFSLSAQNLQAAFSRSNSLSLAEGDTLSASSSAHFVEQAGDFIGQSVSRFPAVSGNPAAGVPARQAQTISPSISITVNSAPNDDPQGLAARIAQAVQDALREISSYEERVAFA